MNDMSYFRWLTQGAAPMGAGYHVHRWVGIGWHPWDFETGEGSSRLRMQVRQSAAKQIWKRPDKNVPFFATSIKPKPFTRRRTTQTL
jgi:hypothetical protein